MAKKKTSKTQTSARLPVEQIMPVDVVRETLSVEDAQLDGRKLYQIAGLLWMPKDLGEAEIGARIVHALEFYESLAPQEGAEGMLAVQMVGTHFAALECLRRAALQDLSSEGRDVNLKHAQKLMTLYAQQLATLDKHRGKGQQKVTVEYVNVEPGGQAIVGNVEAGAAKKAKSAPKAKSLDRKGTLGLDETRAPEPVRNDQDE